MFFETSMQAQFVIPMALSLGFGIVFATTMTLILVPVAIELFTMQKSIFRGCDRRLNLD